MHQQIPDVTVMLARFLKQLGDRRFQITVNGEEHDVLDAKYDSEFGLWWAEIDFGHDDKNVVVWKVKATEADAE